MYANPENPHVLTPRLMLATAGEDVATCKQLLQHVETAVGIADSHGRTPLHEAAWTGNLEICRLLLEKGADPNANTTGEKFTPLNEAIRKGSIEVCRLLVEHGADVTVTEGREFTILQQAVAEGHADLVMYFVDECGADMDHLHAAERSLEDLAKANFQDKMVAFLATYRNALKTSRAVDSALDGGESVPPRQPPKSLSPL